VIATGFVISMFVVDRTNRIALTARRIIATGDLSQRIEIDQRWDDLSNMASVLNVLFDRVEKLMVGIRYVSDNVAHDLKTPLTRLHSNFETLMKHRLIKGETEISALIENMASETDRLLQTFNALLCIARIESGNIVKEFKTVDVGEILRDVMELYEPLAQKKGLQLEFHSEDKFYQEGDPNLLFQAFANIVDNALKFTPEGGRIRLALFKDEGRLKICIEDTGCGIPQNQRENVFQRFFRLDPSRSTEGNGLGLSLVQAVIELHGGSIALKDGNPGLKVEVTL
jgi:signal transduction histidine kinase